jgi:hypothetical protein
MTTQFMGDITLFPAARRGDMQCSTNLNGVEQEGMFNKNFNC